MPAESSKAQLEQKRPASAMPTLPDRRKKGGAMPSLPARTPRKYSLTSWKNGYTSSKLETPLCPLQIEVCEVSSALRYDEPPPGLKYQ